MSCIPDCEDTPIPPITGDEPIAPIVEPETEPETPPSGSGGGGGGGRTIIQ